MIHPVSAPARRPLVAAVTGTNGKTSVATATLQLMRIIGWRAAGYDSTGITDVHGVLHAARVRRSTAYLPDLIEYQARAGATAVSLEAFVGLLADGLFEHVGVDTAVCTGLEADHLDVHGSIDAYWGAKLSLFERHLRPDGVAVLAVDCAQGDLVRAAASRRGAQLVTVGEGGELWLADPYEADGRLSGRLIIGSDSFDVTLPTVYSTAVTNLLLAAAAVIGAGGPPVAVANALAHVVPPPGRLEVVVEQGGITAMVDTAHNPGALRTALLAVRTRTAGRLLVVFGAGGERDRAKRSEMGAIAASLADVVVLTDDNPRREPPERIRSEVRVGCPECIEIPRRKDAIIAALAMARSGDVVLVAGKGDEQTQLIGIHRLAHDDRVVIRQTMTTKGNPPRATPT